jgi:hypothetical protein
VLEGGGELSDTPLPIVGYETLLLAAVGVTSRGEHVVSLQCAKQKAYYCTPAPPTHKHTGDSIFCGDRCN